MPTLTFISSYTISISEGQRAMLQELLENGKDIVNKHHATAEGLEEFNLDWESLCKMFRELPGEEMRLKAEHPGVKMTHGFCI